jgi:outer membrane protein OmpA-like peptidoglycan-associated protein
MKLKKYSLLICLLFATMIAQAQYIKDYRREADKFYEAKDWQNAALNYEKFLTSKKGLGRDYTENNPYAVSVTEPKKGSPAKPVVVPKDVSLKLINYRIAESYRNLDNYKMAAPWYAKVVATDKESYSLSPYYYGVCLRALAKYDEAQTQFSNFLENYKADDDFKKKATAELINLKFIIAQMKGEEQKLFVVNKMKDGVNTTEHGQNTAPFVSNGTLYFTSSRPDTVIVKKQKKAVFNNNIYSYNSGTAPAKAGLPVNDEMHQASASFTPDGKTIYFTRWAMKGLKVAAIYKSTMTATNVWSEPEKLGKDINADGFSSQQPSVTSDGKYLLYASNKTGGIGKFDLWYATLEEDKIGASVNFGEPVNSDENEITPFYHLPSKQLVFSSNGRVGMGGYDLFQAKGTIAGKWDEPKNLGYPVNSQKDEQYFYGGNDKFLLKDFYISSDRGSECCLELYTANKLIKKWLTGKVVDKKTGQPIEGAHVQFANDKGVALPPVTTDHDGVYFVETDPYNSLSANASKETYEPSTQSIKGDFNIDTLNRADWALTPIPPPPPPVITEDKPLIVRFEYDSANISPEYQESLDSLAAMMARDVDMKVEIGGYTDQHGDERYNKKLSQKRADAAKKYLVERYKSDAARLTTKGYGKCCPIEKEVNEDGTENEAARKTNRRLEFKMAKKKG